MHMSTLTRVFLAVSAMVIMTLQCVRCTCDISGNKANCDNRGLTSLPDDLPLHLTELSFSNNELSQLDSKSFIRYSSLEKIDLSFNNIEEVQIDAFEGLYQLINLNLRANKITNLQSKSFVDLERVTIIDMSYNPLGDFPVNVFEDCLRLSRLELSHTGLDERDFAKIGTLPKLNYLDLSENSFSYLPYLMLTQFGFLSQLWLNNCSIQSIDANAFVGLGALRTLKLNENQIVHLNRQSFQPLELAFLELSGNPFQCDCGLSQFKDWLDLGTVINKQTCISPSGEEYDILKDDLSGFCTTVGPPVSNPCGGKGVLSLTLREVSKDEMEVEWTSTSVPNALALSANLRIYGKDGTETWETISVSRKGYTFRRLREGSEYILFMVQRQCELYAHLDFSTKGEPTSGALTEPECISREATAGIAVSAAVVTMIMVMTTVYLVSRGVCCCPQAEDLTPPPSAGPVRQTQPVFPMQTSIMYSANGPGYVDKHRLISASGTDTYEAIPLTPKGVTHKGDHFFTDGYRDNERPRNANDPLPSIKRDAAGITPSRGSREQVLQGVSSSYIHSPNGNQDISPEMLIEKTPISTPSTSQSRRPLRSSDSYPKEMILASELAIAKALSTSDPYHVYQVAKDDDIGDTDIHNDRRKSEGEPRGKLNNKFPKQKLTLEDIKKQIESGGSQGRVKKFRRPAMQNNSMSISTPNILNHNMELPCDQRLLQSNS